jgi:O-antigen/teichoic acid export membrane protein
MLCFTAVSTTYIFGTLLTANGNLKQLNTMAIVGIFINLVLNFILIPHYQAFGSAISSLATQFFTAGIQVYFAIKIFKFKVNVRLLIALFTFIVGIIAFNYLSKYATANWMINFGIACVSCFAWAFISGLISVKSILRFIKYK